MAVVAPRPSLISGSDRLTWRGWNVGYRGCRNSHASFLSFVWGLEKDDVNQTREVARGLLLCPQPGGCSTSSSRGPWCPQCSRLLKSLALGTSEPWHELWDHPDPERLLAAPLDASCMETLSGPQHPLLFRHSHGS